MLMLSSKVRREVPGCIHTVLLDWATCQLCLKASLYWEGFPALDWQTAYSSNKCFFSACFSSNVGLFFGVFEVDDHEWAVFCSCFSANTFATLMMLLLKLLTHGWGLLANKIWLTLFRCFVWFFFLLETTFFLYKKSFFYKCYLLQF